MITNTEYYRSLVLDFDKLYGFKVCKFFYDADEASARFRWKMLKEEFEEYNASNNPVEKLDAICDLMYFSIGAQLELGIHIDPYSGQASGRGIKKWLPLAAELGYCNTELNKVPLCERGLTSALNQLNKALEETAAIMGIDLAKAFAEVHQTNMAKLWTPQELAFMDAGWSALPVPGRRPEVFIVKNEAGKVRKPPGWKSPELKSFIPTSLLPSAP
jgi:hypothetical protein